MGFASFKASTDTLENGIAIIQVNGDLDSHSAKEFQKEVMGAFDDQHFKLIVDLTNVKYMSSAGASVFIVAEEESRNNGGDVVMLNPAKPIQQVLELLGMLNQAKIFDSRNDAIAYFMGPEDEPVI